MNTAACYIFTEKLHSMPKFEQFCLLLQYHNVCGLSRKYPSILNI